jgi:hypothetical protein
LERFQDEGRNVTFGFAPSPPSDPVSRLGRMLQPAEWAAAGIPLLRDPREIVTGLHERHLPRPSTTVIAVLGPEERLVASASFSQHPAHPDGWEYRNALLGQLRRVVPHDLRLRGPVRTAVLLCCRLGEQDWTEVDGAWMWGLRDACTLHGLRCGAYITLTPSGWQVLGERRNGRRPSAVTAQERQSSTDPTASADRTHVPALSYPSSARRTGAVANGQSAPLTSNAAVAPWAPRQNPPARANGNEAVTRQRPRPAAAL